MESSYKKIIRAFRDRHMYGMVTPVNGTWLNGRTFFTDVCEYWEFQTFYGLFNLSGERVQTRVDIGVERECTFTGTRLIYNRYRLRAVFRHRSLQPFLLPPLISAHEGDEEGRFITPTGARKAIIKIKEALIEEFGNYLNKIQDITNIPHDERDVEDITRSLIDPS